MNFIALLIVFAVGIFIGVSLSGAKVLKDSKKETASIKTTTAKATPSAFLSVTSIPSFPPSPTQIKKQIEKRVFSDLKYPNSESTVSNIDSAFYESTDDPDTITNWYKGKIRSFGMNTKSFVQTKTNGNVLNKLAAANGNREINIEITKKNGEPKVKIKVTDALPIDNEKTF